MGVSMNMSERNCPDCNGVMVEGFILDTSYGVKLVSRWIRGRPEGSWWSGVKTSMVECRAVEAYRCEKCGLLKLYAMTKIDPEEAGAP
jgi:Domain of unknown function (DUF6487)